MHTLVINRWETRCGRCGQNVLPSAVKCPSCGDRFVLLRSDYSGMKDGCMAMRPDLTWIGWE